MQAIVGRYQTLRWQQAGVAVATDVIGDRPGGEIADDHPLVEAAIRSLARGGRDSRSADLRISSTDANIPLSRGIPAVCIGITDGGNAHRLDEWIATTPIGRGLAPSAGADLVGGRVASERQPIAIAGEHSALSRQ